MDDGSAEEPEVVYHYTGPDGLAGILLNREIWATDLRYLNDSTEFEYLFSIVKERTSKIANIPAEAVAVTEAAQKMFAEFARFYVACFCKSGDLLSQWRGYAGGIGGFAVGVKWRQLKNRSTTAADGWTFEPVVYNSNTQNSKIDEILIASMQAALHNKLGTDPTPEDFHGLTTEALQTMEAGLVIESQFRLGLVAPTFKSDGFTEEQEWRAVHISSKDLTKAVHFRTSAVGLTPYVKLDLSDQSSRRLPLIQDIVVGPTPYQEIAKDAVRLLLLKVGFRPGEIPIRHSEIPFRA